MTSSLLAPHSSLSFSIEFFPPQTLEGADKLRVVRAKLAALGPEFFSVTYGAGGSTRERTLGVVLEIKHDGLEAAPHFSCIGSTRESIRALLARYETEGIRRIVALRGDLPSGVVDAGEFHYANELVEFIRAETGDRFHIEVAAYPEVHPQAKSGRDDLLNFKRKVDAGANSSITQYFYDADGYQKFVDAARGLGVKVPIVPGIMPVANFAKLVRFSDACGAVIPLAMRERFAAYGDDADSARADGLDLVTELCRRQLALGAPGLHFYSMNQAGLTTEIVTRLRG